MVLQKPAVGCSDGAEQYDVHLLALKRVNGVYLDALPVLGRYPDHMLPEPGGDEIGLPPVRRDDPDRGRLIEPVCQEVVEEGRRQDLPDRVDLGPVAEGAFVGLLPPADVYEAEGEEQAEVEVPERLPHPRGHAAVLPDRGDLPAVEERGGEVGDPLRHPVLRPEQLGGARDEQPVVQGPLERPVVGEDGWGELLGVPDEYVLACRVEQRDQGADLHDLGRLVHDYDVEEALGQPGEQAAVDGGAEDPAIPRDVRPGPLRALPEPAVHHVVDVLRDARLPPHAVDEHPVSVEGAPPQHPADVVHRLVRLRQHQHPLPQTEAHVHYCAHEPRLPCAGRPLHQTECLAVQARPQGLRLVPVEAVPARHLVEHPDQLLPLRARPVSRRGLQIPRVQHRLREPRVSQRVQGLQLPGEGCAVHHCVRVGEGPAHVPVARAQLHVVPGLALRDRLPAGNEPELELQG